MSPICNTLLTPCLSMSPLVWDLPIVGFPYIQQLVGLTRSDGCTANCWGLTLPTSSCCTDSSQQFFTIENVTIFPSTADFDQGCFLKIWAFFGYCLCLSILPECMFPSHVYSWCLQRAEGAMGFLRTGFTDGCEQPCRCWELNLGFIY